MGKFGKKNEIKIDPLSYNICLLGEPKIGKTTIIKEFLERLSSGDSYIFLEMAGEAGADAINGIIYEDCDSWEDVADIIEDIEENKTTDYAELKAIVIDTYDGWIKLAQEEAIRLWNKAHSDKKADSIDASWNGFQKGQAKAFELMFDVICRLRKVGVATIIIGHVKNKEQLDVASGASYSTLTSDVEKVYFNLLKKKMHFLGLAYYDREIVTEKTGKKNAVTKKDITVNKITGEARKIKWRDDNYALDSGCRFSNIEPEIDFTPEAMIESITNAIKAEASKGSKSVEELQKEQAKAEEERMKQIAQVEEQNRANKALEAALERIKNYCKENKGDKTKLLSVVQKAKEMGYDSPMSVLNIDDANAILKLCN